jgi:hypothetical protein
MKCQLHFGALLCLVIGSAIGCRMFHEQAILQGQSPLQPAQASPDSVTMEIIWARFPAGDPAINSEAWREIDETQLSPAVHRALADNGLRAGVIGAQLPEVIAAALHQDATPQENIETTSLTAAEKTAALSAEPLVRGRVRQLRRNQRSEIQASDVYPSLPLLVSGGRELGGRTYQQAQAIYALRVDPQPDRSVVLELTPEIHHGQPRLRWTGGDDGILRQAPLREREVFDAMSLTLRLAPGEMLILTSLPDAGSRLGHYFHTVDSADGPQQKLILIRLAEIPSSDTFAAAN